MRLPEADRELLRSVCSGLDDAQIARLLVAGQLCDIADGTTLSPENQPLERISSFARAASMSRSLAVRVAHLERGNFVGEVAFLTERPAMATVIAEGPVRVLALKVASSVSSSTMEAEVAGLIYQLLGRELAHKIKVSNILLSAGTVA